MRMAAHQLRQTMTKPAGPASYVDVFVVGTAMLVVVGHDARVVIKLRMAKWVRHRYLVLKRVGIGPKILRHIRTPAHVKMRLQ